MHIPTWESMLGAGNTMSSGTEEEWASKENCNAIARERDASCGGKKRPPWLSFCFRELKLSLVPEEPVILELKEENCLIAAILQGSLMSSFTH